MAAAAKKTAKNAAKKKGPQRVAKPPRGKAQPKARATAISARKPARKPAGKPIRKSAPRAAGRTAQPKHAARSKHPAQPAHAARRTKGAKSAKSAPRTRPPEPRHKTAAGPGALRPAPAPPRSAHAPLARPIAPQAPAVPGEPELRITDEAVAKATGRDWTQWCEVLDAAGAQAMPHSDIARLVMERFRLGPWWSQMVTVGFEQLRGLRVKHQKSEGFEISASKTLAASAERVYAAWNQDAERTRWLGQNLRVRGATPIKTLRLAGSDGISAIVVALYPKGAEKTQVTVQHSKLKDAAEAARMKLHWAAALERLRAAVEAR